MRKRAAALGMSLLMSMSLAVPMMPVMAAEDVEVTEETESSLGAMSDELSSRICSLETSWESSIARRVEFNGYQWNIINYDSANNTIALFCAQSLARMRFSSNNNDYGQSEIKAYLDGLTTGNGAFAGVADAIRTVKYKYANGHNSEGESEGKIYLASKSDGLPYVLTKLDIEGDTNWWTRDALSSDNYNSQVVTYPGQGTLESPFRRGITDTLNVRPMLNLDVNKIDYIEAENKIVLAKPITKITIDKPSTQTIAMDGVVCLKANITPADATTKTVTWESSFSNSGGYVTFYSDKACTQRIPREKTDILTVYVKGEKLGDCTVTVSSKQNPSISASCKLKVSNDPNAGKNNGSAKKANTLTVKGKTVTVKAADLKKKNMTLATKKVLTVSKAKGTVSYKITSVSNKKAKKYFSIASKNGKLTMKKKLSKGTYKVNVSVTAKGDKTYKSGQKTATVIVKVK